MPEREMWWWTYHRFSFRSAWAWARTHTSDFVVVVFFPSISHPVSSHSLARHAFTAILPVNLLLFFFLLHFHHINYRHAHPNGDRKRTEIHKWKTLINHSSILVCLVFNRSSFLISVMNYFRLVWHVSSPTDRSNTDTLTYTQNAMDFFLRKRKAAQFAIVYALTIHFCGPLSISCEVRPTPMKAMISPRNMRDS